MGHLGFDNYVRGASNSEDGRDPNIIDVGFELGILPFEKVQMEVGFDLLLMAQDPNDQHPWSGNAKLATPESSMFDGSPALAVGLYNARATADIEPKDAPMVYSGQNIVYGLASKTVPAMGWLPPLGRFSAGYYVGARRALVSSNSPLLARKVNSGLLLSWDRTISEISDKLWFGVDYMEGHNRDGSVNLGFAWRFNKYIALTIGYDIWNSKSVAGENTFTSQIRVDFPQ
ncbi:MAG TPA: hypothetical protein VJ550_04565 [Geomonas sp.]|nr:hypothetical protein [Geomonas sp.]